MKQHIVVNPMAVLREKPAFDSQVADEVVYGMRVTVETHLYTGWNLVHTEYGYPGYIRDEDIMVERRMTGRCEYVRTAFAAVYTNPDIKAPIMMTLLQGSRVSVMMREGNGYTEVHLYDNRIGYIKTCALCSISHGSDAVWQAIEEREGIMRSRLVENAMAYLHTPYRYGGKTPMGIDCSGLCFMAYYMCGVMIWRDSQMKPDYPVHEIARQSMDRGDLLYFDGHVAMYIGEDQFVHATDRMGIESVVVESLNPQDVNYRMDLAQQSYICGSVF